MTHEEAVALMMEKLDGLLAPADAQRLDGHLATCTGCYAEWQALRMVDELLVGAPMLAAPAGFAQRVQLRLDQPSLRRTLGALFALSLGSVVALGLVAVPAAGALAALWLAVTQPAEFAGLLVWLHQLVAVSGTLVSGLWTATRLFLGQLAANPAAWGWAFSAALAIGLWAHLARPAGRIHVSNGNG